MEKPFGHLKVNGTEFSVQYADCSLLVGRLNIETVISGGDLAILNIPFPSAVRFDQLSGKTYSSVDCRTEVFENSIFKPAVCFRHDYFEICSIDLTSIKYATEFLHLALELHAAEGKNAVSLSVMGEIHAECYPIDSRRLLSGILGTIPIRFAEYYLPMIGLHGISEGASLLDVTTILGQPNHRGGGLHQQYGMIPTWIRYTLPSCYLRFQFEDNIATQITIMSLTDPPCDLARTVR
jgi:hypothetical protein